MSITLRWLGSSEEELDRVATTRMRCYAHAARDIERFREGIRADPRARGGDFLLAEESGVGVGTCTSMPLTMWMRGAALPCQGVAYVGTIKTHRRGSSRASGAGIATRLMHETLRVARERGQVLSALMPFRASFYEHFGYGLVERRADWTLPLSVLPSGAFDGVRFFEPADLPDLRRCRQRVAERGQCDVERSPAMWDLFISKSSDGFLIVDRPLTDGEVSGWALLRHQTEHTRDILRVSEIGYEDSAGLLRLLHFLASLRDQYSAAMVTLPADLQLNRILKEGQLPHRPVNHAIASAELQVRLQVRILDSKKLIESLHLPSGRNGAVQVSVNECDEGAARASQVNRFRVEISDGRGEVRLGAAANAPAFECADTTWAAVVSGDLSASAALSLRLASGDAGGAAVLDAFSAGPAPWCIEYF